MILISYESVVILNKLSPERIMAGAMKLREVLEKLQIKGLPSCSTELEGLSTLSDDVDLEIDWDKVNSASRMFRVLANPIRLAILSLLARAELPVCIISEVLGTDQSLISHHLNKLRNEGVIEVRIMGRFRFYRLREDFVENLRKVLEVLSTHQQR